MELKQLHHLEYEKLQNEISQALSEIGELERFSLVSSGGIFAWLLTVKDFKGDEQIAYFLPSILSILFGIIAYGHFSRIKLIGKYIKEKYEIFMDLEKNQKIKFGWETYLNGKQNKWGSLLANGRVLMWVLHILGATLFAIYLNVKN